MKPALSIDQQIVLLRQRGMIIDNEDEAYHFLISNHYYRLNIYFHKLMDTENQFTCGIRFSQIIAYYMNDRWFRNQILRILESIEVSLRAQIAHYLGITYGPDAFYQRRLYKDPDRYQIMFDRFEREAIKNQADPVIAHHKNTYQGKFPIWVIIEYLSFNALSKLYQNLLEGDKKEIANNGFGVNDYLLGGWMHVLSILRNICAHYGYLFRRVYSVKPKLAREFRWDQSRNHTLFAQFLVMRRLVNKEQWVPFICDIEHMDMENNPFQLSDYGFPDRWRLFLTG